MKIKVTKEDLANGIRKSPSSCPVAIAIMKTDKFLDVHVDYMTIWTWDQKGDQMRLVPSSITKKIRDFDAGKKIRPFEFDLPDPN